MPDSKSCFNISKAASDEDSLLVNAMPPPIKVTTSPLTVAEDGNTSNDWNAAVCIGTSRVETKRLLCGGPLV